MKTAKDKQMSMYEAVKEYCPDGCEFTTGGMGAREPFAAVFEVIRQGKKHLTYSTTGVADLGCMVCGTGCVDIFAGGYIGIGVVGPDVVVRRAREKGIPLHIELEEYTNYTAGLRYLAGSMGLPFMPTKSLLGSDIITHNPHIKVIDDPYGTGKLALVPAANPDVAFIHVQRADLAGNCQIFGIQIDDFTKARAAKHVVITCEEIISTTEIRKNPEVTAIPSYCVDAVVHMPYGCFPFVCAGYYCIDLPWRNYYKQCSQTPEDFNRFIQENIIETQTFERFLETKVGYDRLERLTRMERENYTIPMVK